ncbi:MAG: LysR substrate-binding domain-containing protein [Pseudomonadota bacterium]
MELQQLRLFVAVADAGGFAAAAHALNLAPSTVTRSIAALEQSLGVRLLNRTTRSVSLTEAGTRYLSQVTSGLDALDEAAEMARADTSELSGTLRVGASVSFGQSVIAPALRSFCLAHPELGIDLVLSDSVTDVVAERLDVAIRHGTLDDSSLVAQRLAGVSYRLVAAPEYLAHARPIDGPESLPDHACLTYPYEAFRASWRFQCGRASRDIPIRPKIKVSNAAALLTCAESGMGLAILADWLVDARIEAGALVEVLPDWKVTMGGATTESSLWAVTPSRAFMPRKTRTFIAFLKDRVGSTP